MPEEFIASQLDPESNARLRGYLPEHRIIDVHPGVQALPDLPEQTSVLIARSVDMHSTPITEPPAGWPRSLRWIQLASSGIDNFPDWIFKAPAVTSGRGANAHQVAEYALAMIFAAAKHLPELWVKDDTWHFTALHPIRGATLGLLGLGAIGQALARKALALDMRVIALSRTGRSISSITGVTAARDLHDLFAQADHLVLAAPLTAQTHRIVGRTVLASAKPGLHLVNVARGGLIDQEALLEALDSERVGLASLDVTDPEPLPPGHPLYSHPRVRISPHTSALSSEGRTDFIETFLENFARYRRHDPLKNLVDVRRGY